MESSARIAAAVIDWFGASSVAQKKHASAKREWTVLAGLVVTIDETVRVVACGTGTKCLGRRDLDLNGFVLNDCHAEIVARRALLRYLYNEALYHNEATSMFTRDAASGKLTLKPKHELHLYISEPPCGDAAIYPLDDVVVDQLVTARTQREPTTTTTTTQEAEERSELRLTGAKHKRPNTNDDSSQDDKRFAQTVGVARVKSGRSDLPRDKQTLSMSCSDKIALWTQYGVQGVLLLQWYAPLLLTSVIVAEDPLGRSCAAQQHAMERALRDRVPHGSEIRLCVLPASSASASANTRFPLARAADKTPSPLSLNWTRHEPHWKRDFENIKTKSWRSAFFAASGDVEVVMAATGYKEGAKKATQMDDAAKQRVASRLSKWSLFRAYETVRRASSEQEEDPPTRRYADEKERVLGADTLNQRERSKRALGEWVGVPAAFKRFPPFVES